MNSTSTARSHGRPRDIATTEVDLDLGRSGAPPDAELQHLLERVLNGELLHPALIVSRSLDAEETPVEGARAVGRWMALHHRAFELRVSLVPGDVVGARHVKRAVRSLFLYEHQLTPKTRRHARTILWQQAMQRPLPDFVVRAQWAKCRCPRCQPILWTVSALTPPTLLQTA